MDTLLLERFVNADDVTIGRMAMPDGTVLYTVERPWVMNLPRRSCIPCGRYVCVPRTHNKTGQPAIHVTEVPGRSLILFHPANWAGDVNGCIGPGLAFRHNHYGRPGVTESRKAMGVLMEHFGGATFELTIKIYDPCANYSVPSS